MADWSDTKILSTSFFTHSGQNGYEIHFSTPDREKYLAVQKECRGQIGLTKTTQADRIRAMSDEELAEWFENWFSPAPWCENCRRLENPNCVQCALDWLQSPADGGDGNE